MSSQPLLPVIACSPTAVDPPVESPRSATGHNPAALHSESSRPAIPPRTDQSTPKGDPACEHCATPMTQRHLFDQALEPGRYAYGEIVKINESVHVPIEQLLTPCRKAMSLASSGSPSRPRGRHASKGLRPGVVLTMPGNPRRTKGSNGTKTMLLATFSGIDKFDNLPRVLRHFCLPVSPHSEIGADVEHLHTTPEWQRNHAWLILPPFVSSGTVFGRWGWTDKDGTRPKQCSFKLDGAVLSQLEDIYSKRFKEWSANCSEDKGYLEECRKEYQIFKRHDRSSLGGSPLISQASLELQDAPAGTSQQVEPRANEDAPSPAMLPPLPLPDHADVGVVPGGPPITSQPEPSPSHSRQTSVGGRLLFGDTLPLDLDPANRPGVSFRPKIEDWLSKLPPLSMDALQELPLSVPGEPFESESEGDWETASAATTESVHGDAELAVDPIRAALGDATITSPPKGAQTGLGIDGPPVQTVDDSGR